MTTRRQAILDAALATFSERGVEATTIDDIRRRSGASVGSIYHHFGDKEGLADALYVEGVRDYQRAFVETLAGHDDAEPGVKALVAHHLRWVTDNQGLARHLLRRRDVDEQTLNAEFNERERGVVRASAPGRQAARPGAGPDLRAADRTGAGALPALARRSLGDVARSGASARWPRRPGGRCAPSGRRSARTGSRAA